MAPTSLKAGVFSDDITKLPPLEMIFSVNAIANAGGIS
jgi:hypothetical protein